MDGNCLLYAVNKCLQHAGSPTYNHRRLREMICDNIETYAPAMWDHEAANLDRWRTDRVWLSDEAIDAVARITERPIVVLAGDGFQLGGLFPTEVFYSSGALATSERIDLLLTRENSDYRKRTLFILNQLYESGSGVHFVDLKPLHEIDWILHLLHHRWEVTEQARAHSTSAAAAAGDPVQKK
eukprot:TRINITY_DN1781_c0_g2_i1.p1 TRINITY_DN1781_c0_g2~~TRINITY_DN1781_c0_g2_i1.p1  ORF type:complete len:183 (-),score=25.16 TRINITY_DN1781_c0_g2_i1:158-706(-)